jgi:hypothetical protein
MLISMPHGTSTILGAFQAILASPCQRTNFPPSSPSYRVTKSSPMKSFVTKPLHVLLQRKSNPQRNTSNQSGIKGFSRLFGPGRYDLPLSPGGNSQ